VLALWALHLWRQSLRRRCMIAAALAGFLVFQISGVVYVMRRDSYHNSYLPAVEFLRTHKTDLIMGGAELGFAMRFPDNLLDDERLGYHSGKRPDIIVVDDRYRRDWSVMRAGHPEVYRYIDRLTTQEYRVVYSRGTYTILERL